MHLRNLRCEMTVNPKGIETPNPRLSWILDHPERGQQQIAYQVLAASQSDVLQADQGDLWDSGKVVSDQAVHVAYAGSPLQSGQTVYWKVRVWDAHDAVSLYSAPATFEMGLLHAADWRGTWISWNNLTGEGRPLLRKEFLLNAPVTRARLYISGVGYYEARLNGSKVGDHVLDPGWTDYDRTRLYATYDVTPLLRPGSNAIGVMLGYGRFTSQTERRSKQSGSAPQVLAQLNITCADGSQTEIVTDPTWKTAAGPLVFNDLYDGERYDARLERSGWDCPQYAETDWQSAEAATIPETVRLVSQATCPPIKICQTLRPRTIRMVQADRFIYDFGQNFTGWVRLRVSGPRGAEVTLRYAELLYPDGTLNPVPNRSAKATDVYLLKGEGEEVFEPRFTYHGFQYVEVSGFPGTPSLESLEGCVVHSAVTTTGNFLCSHPLINQIHQNVAWGQLSNLMSIPTDCPQRDERMGWLGDAQLTAEEAAYNFDMAGFYTKWVRDMQDAQRPDGSVPDVVPPYWVLYPADPAWGTACLVIPWTVYRYYGDCRILEQHYPLMKRYVEFLAAMAKDDVLTFTKYGDWCPPWHVNSMDTPAELVSQWYYHHDTALLATIAEILGQTEDAKHYRERAERIKAAFNHHYFKDATYGREDPPWYRRLIPPDSSEEEQQRRAEGLDRSFGVRSQTGPALALAAGIAPDDQQSAILARLVDDIVIIHGTHINTGIVGTRYLLDVLSEHGQAELAFKLVTQTTYPGWGYMIKEGATTLWERWEYLTDVGMNSQNHIMLGSVDAWFYRFLAGIQLDPTEPGWKKIRITPYVLGDLTFVSASVQTVRGIVASHWTKGHNTLELRVTIPVNSRATVSVPKIGLAQPVIIESGMRLWEQGCFVQPVPGISSGVEDEQAVTFAVGSGSYCFRVQ